MIDYQTQYASQYQETSNNYDYWVSCVGGTGNYQAVTWNVTYATYPQTVFQNVYWNYGSQWSVAIPATPTPEQIAEREAAKAAAEVAASRADILLMSFLSDSQADQYKRDNRFDLVINGKTYRINKGRSGNIQLIENGKPVAKYCAHPEIWTPDGDTVLAQMLMLKTDEAGFLKIANRTAL